MNIRTGGGEFIRVLLADDHVMIAEILATYLSVAGGMQATTATNLNETVELLAGSGPYDVVLLDFDMPGMGGIVGLKRVLQLCNGTPVAIISGNVTPRMCSEILSAGASGVILKTSGMRTVASAIRFMHAGEFYLPHDLMVEVTRDRPTQNGSLSEKEIEVLNFLSKGKRNREIAAQLNLSEATVKLRVSGICKKLSASNRTQAVIAAAELGLIA